MESMREIHEKLKSFPPLYERELVSIDGVERNESTFSILQFNILADGLSGLREDKGNFYDSPEGSLDFSFRSLRILQEILRNEPDIICLEEMDHFHDYFDPKLKCFGYEGIFAPKPNSPCLLVGGNPDGCALFYKRNKFKLLDHKKIQYHVDNKPENQIALLTILQMINQPNLRLLVGVTHLKALKTLNGENIRLEEAIQLLNEIYIFQEKWNERKLPIVISGDFNARPVDGIDYPAKVYPNLIFHKHSLNLSSAYTVKTGKEPVYTTWKRRPGKESKDTIDYIFYSHEYLQVIQYLDVPKESIIETCRLPSFRYPSDHIALYAEMNFK